MQERARPPAAAGPGPPLAYCDRVDGSCLPPAMLALHRHLYSLSRTSWGFSSPLGVLRPYPNSDALLGPFLRRPWLPNLKATLDLAVLRLVTRQPVVLLAKIAYVWDCGRGSRTLRRHSLHMCGYADLYAPTYSLLSRSRTGRNTLRLDSGWYVLCLFFLVLSSIDTAVCYWRLHSDP